MILAAIAGLLAGAVGWVIVGDTFAVPELPARPAEQPRPTASNQTAEAPAVILTPIGASEDGVIVARGDFIDVVVELRNPDSARYDQLAIGAEVLDGRCSWPDGDLTSISSLGARSSVERVCRLSLNGDDLGALTVVARNAGQEIARARLVATVGRVEADPLVETLDSVPLGGTVDVTPEEPLEPVCPLLGGVAEPASSPVVSELGPLFAARTELLILELCPDWAGATQVQLISGEGGGCEVWSVVSAGRPVGTISPTESEGCDLDSGPIYIDIDVDEVGTDLALQIVVLSAWTLAGDRDAALAVAATLDRTARGSCDGDALLRARPPYLQDLPDGTTSYRTVLEAC